LLQSFFSFDHSSLVGCSTLLSVIAERGGTLSVCAQLKFVKDRNLMWLLALLAVAALLTTVMRSKSGGATGDAECLANLEQLGLGAEAHLAEKGGYPADVGSLRSYLANEPVCPDGGEYSIANDVYSPGNEAGFQDYYIATCSSPAHNYLGYNSVDGPIDPTTARSLPRD
jgi:hypothetical protein